MELNAKTMTQQNFVSHTKQPEVVLCFLTWPRDTEPLIAVQGPGRVNLSACE